MANKINLSESMEERLPAEVQEVLKTASLAAAEQGYGLYLVGGMVRDLLLRRANLDVDLVVEGDAVSVARRMAEIVQGRVTVHSRFGTASVKWDSHSIDFATARSETYSRPGALPTVKPGVIDNDLSRRDFTVNSMAVEISSGRLIDPYNGREDIDKGLIRVLHENSFTDDATRIWRAIRYEQRLDFNLEPDTLKFLKRDIDMLDTISRDRIRRELELALKEDQPEKIIRRAGELGVLKKLHPALKSDDWMDDKFGEARNAASPDSPSPELYLALLAFRLTEKETDEFIDSLRPRKLQTKTLRDVCLLKNRLDKLSAPGIKHSEIYDLLHGLSRTALTAVSIADGSPTVKDNIHLYLNNLKNVRTVLTGKDLQIMGVPPGPRMKEILRKLLEARLNGTVIDRKGEIEMVENTRL